MNRIQHRLKIALTATFALSALVACGPALQLHDDFGASLQGLTNGELMQLSRKTVSDVDETAATGDAATVTETRVNPAKVCGLDPRAPDSQVNALSAQEREVLELLTREEALGRLIQLATEVQERIENAQGPDVAKLQTELEEVRAALERLQNDSSYQDAFEKGRQILAERQSGQLKPVDPGFSEEQRACLQTELHKIICADATRVLTTGLGPGGREVPEHMAASFERFHARHCQAQGN